MLSDWQMAAGGANSANPASSRPRPLRRDISTSLERSNSRSKSCSAGPSSPYAGAYDDGSVSRSVYTQDTRSFSVTRHGPAWDSGKIAPEHLCRNSPPIFSTPTTPCGAAGSTVPGTTLTSGTAQLAYCSAGILTPWLVERLHAGVHGRIDVT